MDDRRFKVKSRERAVNFTKRFRLSDRDAQPQLRDLHCLTRAQNVRPERRQHLRTEKQPSPLARHAQPGHIGIAELFPAHSRSSASRCRRDSSRPAACCSTRTRTGRGSASSSAIGMPSEIVCPARKSAAKPLRNPRPHAGALPYRPYAAQRRDSRSRAPARHGAARGCGHRCRPRSCCPPRAGWRGQSGRPPPARASCPASGAGACRAAAGYRSDRADRSRAQG